MKALLRLVVFLALAAPAALPGAALAAEGPPSCVSFTATPVSIIPGGRSRLEWHTLNSQSGVIIGVGNVIPNGSAYVRPSITSTYTATFTGPGGRTSCSATVGVNTTGSGVDGSGGVGPTAPVEPTPLPEPTPVPQARIVSPSDFKNPDTTGFTLPAVPKTPSPSDFNIPSPSDFNQVGEAAPPKFTSIPMTPLSGGGLVSGLVPQECIPKFSGDKNPLIECDLCAFGQLIQNIINFLIGLSVPVAALLFAVAGILYFSSRGSPEQIIRATKIFKSVLIGFGIILAAYLLVQVIMQSLVNGANFKDWSWNEIKCYATREQKKATNTTNQSFQEFLSSSLPYLTTYVSSLAPSGGGLTCGGLSYDSASGRCRSSDGTLSDPVASVNGPQCTTGGVYSGVIQGCVNRDGEVVPPISTGGTGSYGTARGLCADGNTACSPAALQNLGFNQNQANALSCIAITESSGDPNTPDSRTGACGLYQFTNQTGRSNWQNPTYHGAGCSTAASDCYRVDCQQQTLQIMFNQQGYQPWTGAQNGVPWNPNARACVQQYDPGAINW